MLRSAAIWVTACIVCCATWEYFGSHFVIVRLLISRPTLVFEYALRHSDTLLIATRYTLIESLLGLAIAATFSFGVMFVCFYFPKLLDLVLPVMVTSQVIPLITLAPLLIMLLGIGLQAKVMMAALLSFFPLFVYFAAGFKAIPASTNELLYIYAAPTLFRIVRINIPLSLPSIMAGIKVSATLSVMGAIVAEFNGADYGLGKNLFLAAKRLEPELMMVSIIITALMGGLLYQAVRMIERRIGKWYS